MTKNILPLLLGLALTSIPAAGQPSAVNSLLRGSIESLRGAGYGGLDQVALSAPAAAPASAATGDPTQDALPGLIGAAEGQPETPILINETARALGFEFEGHFAGKQLEKQSTADSIWYFSIAKFQGETVVILEVLSKTAKELRSYRASATGVLQAAVVTKKSNGAVHAASIALPNPAASADFDAQTSFWTQYYRDHLKH